MSEESIAVGFVELTQSHLSIERSQEGVYLCQRPRVFPVEQALDCAAAGRGKCSMY
jgi:hypothetical protein